MNDPANDRSGQLQPDTTHGHGQVEPLPLLLFRSLGPGAVLARIPTTQTLLPHQDLAIPIVLAGDIDLQNIKVAVQIVSLMPADVANGLEIPTDLISGSNAAPPKATLSTRFLGFVAHPLNVVVRIHSHPIGNPSGLTDTVTWPPDSGVVVVVNSGASDPRSEGLASNS